uniref:Uncharacterized protein n=1 Tax=Pseudoalteromonas undina TaxID=43660 RepID=A0ABP2XW12_9GAMM|tara:strand:+ start:232 stop:429 length:198 start_codon:yes stop_codon:yes gene_type:complete
MVYSLLLIMVGKLLVGTCVVLVISIAVLKHHEVAIKGSKNGKLLSNCGKKMAIVFLTVLSAKTSL